MQSSKQEIETALRSFIARHFLAAKDAEEISNDDSLLESGLIDSTAIFDLVGFIEKEFGFQVDDSDVVPGNFENLGALTSFVQERLQSKS